MKPGMMMDKGTKALVWKAHFGRNAVFHILQGSAVKTHQVRVQFAVLHPRPRCCHAINLCRALPDYLVVGDDQGECGLAQALAVHASNFLDEVE
jgi:hypothetical protein